MLLLPITPGQETKPRGALRRRIECPSGRNRSLIEALVHTRSIRKRDQFKMQSERMNLAANELTHRVRGHFKLDLQREIFDAAVENFDHEDIPLGLKNFAFTLKELSRIWLEQLAPKEKIRACEWFEQNTDLREEDGVTRAQRTKYAVQGELHDEFVLEDLHIDVQSTVKEYLALIDELSNYGRFDIPAKTAELEAIRALETFDQLSELIQERHASLLSSAADAAKRFATNQLLGEADEELHRLSMHFSGGDYHLDSLLVLSHSQDRILYQGRGRVYVRTQYEWDSAVAWDDVAVVLDVYPFECSFEAHTGDPLFPCVVRGSMKIDTDFYDNDIPDRVHER